MVNIIVVMKGGQIFTGIPDKVFANGIVMGGYCTILRFHDMISCRDLKKEIDYLNRWEEPTHVLLTVTGEPIFRGSLEECEALMEVSPHVNKGYYRVLEILPKES